jgi:hypothetical protein
LFIGHKSRATLKAPYFFVIFTVIEKCVLEVNRVAIEDLARESWLWKTSLKASKIDLRS